MARLIPLSLPSQEYLCSVFSYDPATGEIKWKYRPLTHFKNSHTRNMWNSKFAYKNAGTILYGARGHNYIRIILDWEKLLAHRIIWKIMTGEDPPNLIDHRDNNGLNNSWDNLRDATYTEQAQNTLIKKNNPLGLKGVYQRPYNRFGAAIRVNGKQIFLGVFDTPEQAHEAYCKAAKEAFGEFFNKGHS